MLIARFPDESNGTPDCHCCLRGEHEEKDMAMKRRPKEPKRVAIVYKPVGDEPYVTELFAEGHKHRRYRKIYDGNDELNCATALVGGYVERVHLGGRAFLFCNENGLLIGLPKNSCGFVGDFFIRPFRK